MEDQDLAVIIGKNIMRLRKMANMTQLELAEKLNYSDKSVSKWEQGNGIPDVRILVQISELFKVSVDDLVRDRPEREVMPEKIRLRKRLIVLGLSVGLCWLAAVLSFVFGIMLPKEAPRLMWLAFLYAVPASSIVVLVFSCIWSWKWVRFISISVLIWTTLTCAFLTVFLLVHYPKVGLIYLIGVPLQILTVLWLFRWKPFRLFK